VSDPSCSVVSPPERTFQASPLAIWWRWSLVRLLVIISNRYSVRTAPRPRRRNRVTPLLWRMADHRLDHLCAFSVKTLAHLRVEHVSHPGVTTAGPALPLLASEAGHELYKHRAATVEPVFAQNKFNRGFRRFQRLGRAAARSEWRFQAATHNLLKLHNHWISPMVT
jgi:hypothetical protein